MTFRSISTTMSQNTLFGQVRTNEAATLRILSVVGIVAILTSAALSLAYPLFGFALLTILLGLRAAGEWLRLDPDQDASEPSTTD